MPIRISQRACSASRFRSILFCCALAPACAYPAQVLTQSAMAAAAQYVAILVAVALAALGRTPSSPAGRQPHQRQVAFAPVVWVYFTSFTVHILSCLASEQWIGYVAARNTIVFASPLAGYFAARSASPGRAILFGLATAGMVTGALWVAEAVHRAISGDVHVFAFRAFEYASLRMGETQGSEQSNFNRINPASRVYGVQEFARISATWWSMGVAAVAALLVDSGSSRRTAAVLAAGLLVLIACQSVTAILAFGTAVLCAFGLQEAKTTAVWLAAAMAFLLAVLAAATLTAAASPAAISASIADGAGRLWEQALFIFAPVTWSDDSYLQMTLGNITEFARSAFAHPMLLLTGEFPRLDGTANLHTPGGDSGFLDSVSNFGLPLTLVMGIMTLNYIARARSSLVPRCLIAGPNLRCFVFMIVFVAVMDFHYSVWNDKSIIVALGLLAGASDAEGRGRTRGCSELRRSSHDHRLLTPGHSAAVFVAATR